MCSGADLVIYIPLYCPLAVADCGLLVDPANGNITYSDGTVEGSVATYMCDPEFELEGEPTRNCGSNGEWTGDAVTCAGGERQATCSYSTRRSYSTYIVL